MRRHAIGWWRDARLAAIGSRKMTIKSQLQTLSTNRGINFARALRGRSTDAERLLWSKLRSRQLDGWKFRRQIPMGSYVVDFLCEEARLIVELDGGQHADAVAHDTVRTAWLNKSGYRVVRFWNNDAMNNIDGVLQSLTLTLSQGRGNVDPASQRTGDVKPKLQSLPITIPSPLGEG